VVHALTMLRRRPGRAALTALGIGLATGLVVLLLALSAGVEQSAASLGYASGVDLLATSGSAENSSLLNGSLPPIPGAHHLAETIPKADPNVAVASPWLLGDLVFGNSTLRAEANNSTAPPNAPLTSSGAVGWLPSDIQNLEAPPLYAGTGFTASGDPYYDNGTYHGAPTHEIEIDQGLASVLGVTVNSTIYAAVTAPPANETLAAWFNAATPFRVVGVTGPFWLVPSALLAYTYLSELQALLGGGTPSTDYASLVLIHLADPTDPAVDQAKIASSFPNLTVFTLGEILGAIQHVVNVYRTFGLLIGAIGLVVAALFTTTILQMSVDDRSREFALLRALGHSPARVGSLVVQESLVLAGAGLAVGLAVAFLAAEGLNRFLVRSVGSLPKGFSFVAFDPTVLVTGALLVVALGLAAAFAPALRAMRLPVAEELRAP
jgi:ABC-type lipoprotein release transport system permease subunit